MRLAIAPSELSVGRRQQGRADARFRPAQHYQIGAWKRSGMAIAPQRAASCWAERLSLVQRLGAW